MNQRGFTVVEVTIAAAVFGVMSIAALGIAMTGQGLYVSAEHQMHASTRAHGLMDRVISELRQGSILGEDVDDDDDPDDLDSEDVNGNGRIEDDWSLAEGETATSISFNVARGGGFYSDAVTFRFDGERLWRDSGGASAVLANDATAVTFTRRGRRVTVNVIVESGVVGDGTSADRGGRQVALRRDIMLRN